MFKIGSLIKIKNPTSFINLPKNIEYGLVIEYDFKYGTLPLDYNVKTLVGDTLCLMREIDIENV